MTAVKEGAGRTALVTGASAGIGEALARIVAGRGFDLVLTARRVARLTDLAVELERTHAITARVIPGDLARPETCADLVGALDREGIAIDMLINNAGYGISPVYLNTPWAQQRDLLQVMVVAPCEMTHRLLPGMVQRGYGRIINVASVAGLLPGARGNTLYGAAKALLIGFTQSLHTEQMGTGVHVSALCPGFTRTEFHEMTGSRARRSQYSRFLWLDVARVAEEGYRAVMRNQPVCIPGLQYKAIVGLARLSPLALAHRIAAYW